MKKGKLIVFEGTDCSGKETQSNLIVKFLNENNFPTKKFAFPNYNSPTGKIIAGAYLGKEGYMAPVFEEGASNVDTYVASLLFAMDRKYNIKEIEQSLNDGFNVVLDRYIDSNMAHQSSKVAEAEQEKVFNFIEKLEYDLLELPKADLELFLHMPIWAGKELKANRAEKPDQHEQNNDYLIRSENTYLKLAKRRKMKTIECTINDRIKTVPEIHAEIKAVVLDYLNKN
ncbi:MAG: dTMP kinase [Clostridiales bacterium]|nr:dTMP kinase [Clostridiales bacterium]